MNNLTLIEAKTVGAGGVASVSFNSIPATYTDLQIVMSVRGSAGDAFRGMYFTINSSASDFAGVYLQGGGSGNAAAGSLARYLGAVTCAGATANSFSSVQLYIPNYRLALLKTMTADLISESNSTQSFQEMTTNRWSVTSPITDITFAIDSGNIVQNSTFYLYGIQNTVASGAKAYGGLVIEDSTYWYHAFQSSGTFIPTQSLTADVLVIAGGGGGACSQYANSAGGGGGAGGHVLLSSQSLTATTYAITVGAGGVAGSASVTAANGGNSQFASTTAAVGGGRASGWAGGTYSANSGGSGGGAQGFSQGAGTSGGAGTPGQGFAGGSSTFDFPSVTNYASAGGGGAGAVGQNAQTQFIGGNGGVGTSIYSSWLSATGYGQSISGTYFIGGGGGAGGYYQGGTNVTGGVGGSGGGGNGSWATTNNNAINRGFNGLTNTGGGGGGGTSAQASYPAGAGGSGLVIVRYAK
jgi:hypothetical protein